MIRASQKIRAEVSTSTAEFSASKNQKNETYSSIKFCQLFPMFMQKCARSACKPFYAAMIIVVVSAVEMMGNYYLALLLLRKFSNTNCLCH